MPISRCNRAGFRLLLGLALVIVTWLALTPQPVPMSHELPVDKWAHMSAFALLAFLVDVSWPSRGFDTLKWTPLIAYGLGLEFAQTLVPNRVFDTWDIAANTLGVAVYAILLVRILRAAGLR